MKIAPDFPVTGTVGGRHRAPPHRTPARDGVVLFIGLLAIVAWDATGLDLTISRLFGDASGFAWRDQWLFAVVLHEGAKWLAWAIGGLLLVGIWRPLPFARACPKGMRVWWLATTLACVALIPLLKQFSLTSCPWSLTEFGGTARYVSHWAFGQADDGPGRCFPAGHATTAFCFLAGYFALRDSAPTAARWWLLGTIVFGIVLGMTQVVRGAHYVSHSMWTAWWCWALTVALLHATRLRARLRARRAALA
jgi:membrane-associated PAP2 superfamily phosphatase